MGQCGAGFVCVGFLVLVLGPDFAAFKSFSRIRRQVDTWRRRYEETGWSSDYKRYQDPGRRLQGPPVGDHLRYGRGSVGYSGGGLQARQLQQPSPIQVRCMEDRMVVTVMRDLYGNETLLNDSDITLGPQSCGAGPHSTDAAVVFETGLQECGNSLQMTPDGLIYGTNLTFKPMSGAQNMPVTGSSPAVVPIQCYYPRYGNVSSQAVKPTWLPFSSTVSSEEQLVFSLRLMTEDWSAPRPSLVFSLGDVFYIEASLEGENHVSMILFIDRCVATTSPDPSSSPRYEIIAHNGCLVDGTLQESSSAFRSPRPQGKLQFMVDAFQLVDSQASMIYITCSLRAAADTQVPDPINKACSYNKTSNSWSAVEGPSDICQCCNTQDCATPYGESRGWHPSYRRQRGLGKRQDGQGPWLADRQALASVGPLLVLGEEQRHSLAMPGSSTVETWFLGGVGGLCFVVVLICGAVIGRSMKKKGPSLAVEE